MITRNQEEVEYFSILSFYFFDVLHFLYKLHQVIMSSSTVSLDFICNLIVNLLNLLVNALLLWQSQKLFVNMVCRAGVKII